MSPAGPAPTTATRSFFGFSRNTGGAIFPVLTSQSEANRFRDEIAIGSSISPRLHVPSQGWTQTRPQTPARGIVSLIRLRASS